MPLLLFLILSLVVFSPYAVMADDTLTLNNTIQTFKDDFKEAPLWRKGITKVNAPIKPLSDPSFSWAAGYVWNHPYKGFSHQSGSPAWTSNGNANADPNGDLIAIIGKKLSPLTWSGTLNLTARPMPEDLAKTISASDPKGYMGASIISFPYAQTYGVFAISAKLPKGKGTWPAFWLVQADKTWPPELDIFEELGNDTTTFYSTAHSKGPHGSDVFHPHTVHTGVDLSKDFHEYAVDWGPKTIHWYFDGKLVASEPTPHDLNKPCFMIANLAIGKRDNWPGAPDASTPFPATMQVSYIHVWQRREYLQRQE